MQKVIEVEKLIDRYVELLKDSHQLALIPSMEGDILNLADVRQDIHENYESLTGKEKGQVSEAVTKLRLFDRKLQDIARATRSSDFRLSTSGKYSEWWFNLDRLDELESAALQLL